MNAKGHYKDADQGDDETTKLRTILKRSVEILDPWHIESVSEMLDKVENKSLLQQMCFSHFFFYDYTNHEINVKLDLLPLPIFHLRSKSKDLETKILGGQIKKEAKHTNSIFSFCKNSSTWSH